MKYLPDGKQMKRADSYTIQELRIPSLELMERAARGVVDVIERQGSDLSHICVVCGSGNNGGDGFAVARMFAAEGFKVTAVSAGNPAHYTEETSFQRKKYEETGAPVSDRFEENEYSIIIDALFGVGLSREVTGEYAALIERMNKAEAVKAAIDIPSGVSADTGAVLGTAFQADYTVTFQAEKLGLCLYPGQEYAGEVFVKDIGICEKIFEEDSETACRKDPCEYRRMLPERKADSNKGSYGRLLVIAGSEGMSGAAYLNALAAYRTGAGLVRIYTPETNRMILQQQLPEAIVTSYREYNKEEIKGLLKWADTVCIGSGIGTGETAKHILETVLEEVEVPCVIDADGLNLMAGCRELLGQIKGKQVILTPHMKEFSRLAGKEVKEIRADRPGCIRKLVEETGAVCVMKDARTLILAPDSRLCVNMSGCAAMAKAGAGDVLSGMISALLAQGMQPKEAAELGVYLHGAAGEIAADKQGRYSILAGEIADAAGEAIRKLEGETE